MPQARPPRLTAQHRLPTNTTSRHHAVHRWLNFIAGFSPEFVSSAIAEAGIDQEEILLDPFAGMGTALVAANGYGLHAVGYEPHPFFADIAIAKVSTRELKDVDVVQSILSSAKSIDDLRTVWSLDACTFLRKLVSEENLRFLAGARIAEDLCPPPTRKLYRLVVSRILEGATGSMTDGIYKAPTTSKRAVDIQTTTATLLSQIREDLCALDQGSEQLKLFDTPIGRSTIFPHSAENMSEVADDSVSICVTSPPYLNNFDFAEMTRMELYFWNYASSWREITDIVRSKLIINTTTAPTFDRRRQDYWATGVPAEMLDDLIALRTALTEQRLIRPGKKEYDSLVLPYFSQMYTVIQEVHRVLKPGAPFHLVVSDAALYGVHVHTEALISRLMRAAGLEVKDIVRLRSRGDRWVLAKREGSAEGLGEFHIHAIKNC